MPKETFKPTGGMAAAAKRAQRWIEEGHAGSGFTDVGRKRASQLAARKPLSLETVKRMYSFFSRHEVDKKGKDFNNLSKPSPGRVAWDAWGGDAGYSWARRIVESRSDKAVTIEQTNVFARLLKSELQPDGTLLVTGIATDDSLDSDEQVCDPDWLKSAMPGWFRWGNIREQHSNIAAGVATEYKVDGAQHLVTARVVDPSSVKKVEAGVLKGFSIGIRNARVAKDEKAAGGRIIDGEIVEISLVDRPANPACTISLAKTVNGTMTAIEELTEKAAEESTVPPKKPRRGDAAAEASAAEESTDADDDEDYDNDDEESSLPPAEKAAAEESSQKPGEESSQSVGEESSRDGGVAGVAGKAAKKKVKAYKRAMKDVGARLDAIEQMCKAMYDAVCGTEQSAAPSKSLTADLAKALDERVALLEKSATDAKAPVRIAVSQKAAKGENDVLAKAAEYRQKAMNTTNPTLAEGYLALALDLERSI